MSLFKSRNFWLIFMLFIMAAAFSGAHEQENGLDRAAQPVQPGSAPDALEEKLVQVVAHHKRRGEVFQRAAAKFAEGPGLLLGLQSICFRHRLFLSALPFI